MLTELRPQKVAIALKASDLTRSAADRTFGYYGPTAGKCLVTHTAGHAQLGGPGWLAGVHAGKCCIIPTSLNFAGSVELAHLIDGYALAWERGVVIGSLLAAAKIEVRRAGGATKLLIIQTLDHRRYASPRHRTIRSKAVFRTCSATNVAMRCRR